MAEIKKLDKSQLEIAGEISAEEFGRFWDKAVGKLSQSVKIDGFRPGHIPEDVLIKNVGEGAILDTAAELALQENYPKIILSEKINAIGRPMITITKIARGNPLGWKIVVATVPEVSLPDYRAIAGKIVEENGEQAVSVSDKEIDDLIEDLKKRRAPDDGPSPDFNDEFVRALGDFKDVGDFREKMKKNLALEKESMAKERLRVKIVDAINEKSKMELPDILVENELGMMIAQMKREVEAGETDFEEFLKQSKKSLDDLKKDFRGRAEKTVKYNLIIKNIAKNEAIAVPAEEVAAEAEKLMKIYQGADPESARAYVEDIMVNNRVFKFLENN